MSGLDVARLRSEFQPPHEELRASDGKTLFLRTWPSAARSETAVLLFPGITAYSEPYGPLLAEELSRGGFPVYGLDFRGHGRSDGVRGDSPSPERWGLDLVEAAGLIRGKHRRLVALGHSLGALSAMNLLSCEPKSVDGLVLLSAARAITPGVYRPPRKGAALKALLAVALFRHRRWIEYRRTGMLGLKDTLFVFHFSPSFYASVYGAPTMAVARSMAANRIDSPFLEARGAPDLPVLVGVGDQDELFTVESVRAFVEGLPFPRKELFVVPGAKHAVFPAGSWGPLLAWLRRNFPTAPPT